MLRDSRDSSRIRGRAAGGRATPQPAAPGRPVLPDPFYYLNNFRTVLSSLEARYWDLLSSEERQFITGFAELHRASCALLVRMIMRKGDCFRLSRLQYAEIGDSAAAAAALVDVGWLDDEPVLDGEQLHRLLTKAEILSYLPRARHLSTLRKSELLEVLRAQSPESQTWRAWFPHSNDRVYRARVKPLAERFRLTFFGNFRQDWTEFVLKDLGINSFERIEVHSAPFSTRAQIDAFCELAQCQRDLDDGAAPDRVHAAVPAPICDSDWLEEHRQRLLFQVALAYERRDDHWSALAVLSGCRCRGARMRRVRLLERLREWRAARELCLAAREQAESESERQQMRRVLPRLNRKLGMPGEAMPELPGVASFEILLDTLPSDRSLEIHLRDQLARQDAAHSTVHYVENRLIDSLFTLLCWKAIFAPIPGAFFHDFQYGPADLESGAFYDRRRHQFAECFAEFESTQYQETIRQRFQEKRGIQAPFVAWGLLNEKLLDLALLCFPAAHLRLWFEWMVRDLVENRSGFPDLVQFWPEERRYRMVEVKGPGDRLQDNQRRFLEFCIEHDMPVAVCRVRSAAEMPVSGDVAATKNGAGSGSLCLNPCR